MAELILRPSGDSSIHWSANESVTNYNMVNETAIIRSTWVQYLGTGSDLYTFPNHTTENGTISSVKVVAWCKYFYVDISYAPIYLCINSTKGNLQNITQRVGVDYEAEYSQTWTTNPAGGNWTWTDIDDLVAGYDSSFAWGTSRAMVIQSYVVVTYTPSAPTRSWSVIIG